QQTLAQMNVLLHEVLSGTKIVKAFGREPHEIGRFERVNRGLLTLALKDHRTDELTDPLMEVLAAVGIMGALWYGGDQVISGALLRHDGPVSRKEGAVVGFVGMSGAGKSTLMDLLPRFHDVDAGRSTIDGHDLRDVTQASLRSLFGLVTQETFLFSDSILYNIAYGRLEAPFDDVVRAARQAHAEEFI